MAILWEAGQGQELRGVHLAHMYTMAPGKAITFDYEC
jgi:hypothetical protein